MFPELLEGSFREGCRVISRKAFSEAPCHGLATLGGNVRAKPAQVDKPASGDPFVRLTRRAATTDNRAYLATHLRCAADPAMLQLAHEGAAGLLPQQETKQQQQGNGGHCNHMDVVP